MYFLSNKIKGIVAFEITNFSIVLIEKKSANNYRLIQNEKSILEFNFTSLTKGLFSHIVVSDDDNNIYIFDKQNFQNKLEGYSLSEKAFNKNEIIISKRISRGIFETFIYNLIEKTIYEPKNIPVLTFNSILFFSVENKVSQSTSLLTGEFEWETNLEPYGEIRKILGVKSEKLWVSMDRCGENKDKNSLLALDVNTGQILYQAPSEYDLSDWFIELIPEQNTILSIYGKMSTHKADSPLVEMNATTGVLIRNQRIESLYHENLKIGFWKVLDNKIYFTANKDTLHGRHIGILDYNTLEILWQTEIKDLRGTFKDFQVTQDKIYVLDTGNQLHIFEKEE
tara:strand:- start:12 stop:1028 length:1017 start_codon:yes stop_codon:yes gene_type:complete